MDIETLAEDLETYIVSVRIADEGDVVLEITCDDYEGNGPRRHFELFCSGVKDFSVSAGAAGAIEFSNEHPVLLEHKGAQGALFFSSAPERPDKVFFRVHATFTAEFDGWKAPSQFLNGDPATFRRYLEGGHGLLARGPVVVLEKLKASLEPLLPVSVVRTHEGKPHLKALILGPHWIICTAVRVKERAGE